MKYKSKTAFLEDAATEWDKLWRQIEALPEQALTRRRKNVGQLAWSVKDVVAHLYEWHCLLLNWHKTGLANKAPDLPAKGYNWRMTKELNKVIYNKHYGSEWASLRRKVKRSHQRIMTIVDNATEKEFMEAGLYNWTGKLSLCSFVSANTASHYRWAQKKIRKLNPTTAK